MATFPLRTLHPPMLDLGPGHIAIFPFFDFEQGNVVFSCLGMLETKSKLKKSARKFPLTREECQFDRVWHLGAFPSWSGFQNNIFLNIKDFSLFSWVYEPDISLHLFFLCWSGLHADDRSPNQRAIW